ncbi:MAG: phosphoglucomutase/phosphomannomutase family protein, partial [Chloroflexi bacterium]
DLRLARPVSRAALTRELCEQAPQQIGALRMREVQSLDGVKYLMEDDSWLLIRASGTEPVLRVYAEARTEQDLAALLDYGKLVAQRA